MIVTNEVDIQIVGRNLKYYRDKNYVCNVKDVISVKVSDLPDSCRSIIVYRCDYCNIEHTHGYNVYKKSLNTNGKKACNNCKNIKIEETNLERYGHKRPIQNKKIRKKLEDTNQLRYGNKIASKNIDVIKKISDKNKDNYIKIIDTLNIGKFIKINDFGTYDILCDKCNKIYEFNPSKNGCNRIYTNKTPCYNCLPLSKTNAEIEIYDFIKQHYDGEIILNSRNVIKPYELDIYLPDLNIAVEYNGLYWHSDIYKHKNYHLNKTNMCNDKNIHLIHVFEDEWVYKQDIIKSIILNQLGKSNIIYGRKCIMKNINSKDAKLFFDKYHLQGHRNSNYYYGLFYNDELVSAISVNNKTSIFINNKDKNTPELIRYCTNNSIVIGGLSKLIKYFLNETNNNTIISYTDKSKFNAKGYLKSGFEIISESDPGYTYSKNNLIQRFHRFKFTKQNLIKLGYVKNKSASLIMDELGYYKIYDCGQLKLIYKKRMIN